MQMFLLVFNSPSILRKKSRKLSVETSQGINETVLVSLKTSQDNIEFYFDIFITKHKEAYLLFNDQLYGLSNKNFILIEQVKNRKIRLHHL